MTLVTNREAVVRRLSDAQIAIENLIQELQSGEYGDGDSVVLEIPFEYILSNLCLAWHSRSLTDDETDGVDDLIRYAVPNWRFLFKMVHPDDFRTPSP